jgi:hypothetical protein
MKRERGEITERERSRERGESQRKITEAAPVKQSLILPASF